MSRTLSWPRMASGTDVGDGQPWGGSVSAALSYGTVCSGVEGFGRGFEQAGFGAPRFFCEASEYRRRVLARHWPGVPCHHDLTQLDARELAPVDVLAGGTPCPDFSHAKAQREGLEGSKSRLFWDFARVRNQLSPEWTVWENVDGALTSSQGLDFALVLGAFVGADVHVPRGGWASAGVVTGPWGGASWRVLDAQHFGTPQRRHRVFVIGRLGGPCPPEVLLEPASSSRDSAPRDQAPQDAARALGERVAGTLGAYAGHGGLSRSQVLDGHGAYVAAGEPVVSVFRKAQKAHHDADCERWEPAEQAGTLAAGGGDANGTLVVPFDIATAEGQTPTGARQTTTARALRASFSDDPGTVLVLGPEVATALMPKVRDGDRDETYVADVAATLTANGNGRVDPLDDNLAVAFQLRSNGSNAVAGAYEVDTAGCLMSAAARAGGGTTEETVVLVIDGVRRLTPTECERIQGFPDGWTIPYGPSLRDAKAWHQGAQSAEAFDPPERLDTPRRSAMGDAVNTAVTEWVGRRVLAVAEALV